MKQMRVDVYQDSAGGWRWRLRAGNSRVVADGAEGYSSKRKVVDAINRLLIAVDDGVLSDALERALIDAGR